MELCRARSETDKSHVLGEIRRAHTVQSRVRPTCLRFSHEPDTGAVLSGSRYHFHCRVCSRRHCRHTGALCRQRLGREAWVHGNRGKSGRRRWQYRCRGGRARGARRLYALGHHDGGRDQRDAPPQQGLCRERFEDGRDYSLEPGVTGHQPRQSGGQPRRVSQSKQRQEHYFCIGWRRQRLAHRR